jgi:pantetheine-phosphate adenylyltransferase
MSAPIDRAADQPGGTEGAPSGVRVAVYAGSFDPVTNGHVDIVRRALAVADRVVVAVAVNSTKQPLFTMDERAELLEASLADLAARRAADGGPRVVVRHFQGLLVEFAREVGATLNVRGLRAVADYEYEAQMAHMNRHVRPELETVLLVPAAGVAFVSSSLVREVARLGGRVDGLVPAPVEAALRARFAR